MKRTRNRKASQRGSTLVLVLVVGTLLGFLALVTAEVASRGRKDESVDRANSDLSYSCEGATELLRLELTNHWEQSRLMPNIWFQRHVRNGETTTPSGPKTADIYPAPNNGAPAPGCGTPRTYAAFPGVQAWVATVGPSGQNWIEVVGATTTAGVAAGDQRKPQSVRVRFNWGNNPIFDLAMLTVTTNCMFCHLRVNGDVGSIGFFRPGWGSERVAGNVERNNNTSDGAEITIDDHGMVTAMLKPGQPAVNSYPDGANSAGGGSTIRSYIVGELFVAPAKASAPAAEVALHNLTNDGPTWTDGASNVQQTLNGGRVLKPDADDTNADTSTLSNNVQGDINLDYTGARLPKDTNGDSVADFPAIDVAQSRLASKGKLGIGASATAIVVSGTPTTPNSSGAWRVPLGSTMSSVVPLTPGDLNYTNASGEQSSVVQGNLILIGTFDNPIRLDQDVFVEGDVIIKGYVDGKGAIYAGRNIYVAGDIIYKNPPTISGTMKWPLKDDNEARDVIQQDPDATEVRLAARANIVVGDWTYRADRNADGTENEMVPQRDRQGAIFIRDQFKMNLDNRYYESEHSGTSTSFVSNELRYDSAANKFFNDLDQEVPANRVARVTDGASPTVPSGVTVGYDIDSHRYDSVIAPGTVKRDNSSSGVQTGHFQPWMTQGEFRQVLGTQLIENGVARTGSALANDATKQFEFGDNGYSGAQFNSTNAPGLGSGKNHFEANLNGSGGYAGTGRIVRDDGKIVDVGPQTWSTQVQHVDAFLYANKRIAGTSRYAMTVNGGMAASEIGVLAVYDYNSGFMDYNPSVADSHANSFVNQYTSTSNSKTFLTGHRTWMDQANPMRTYTAAGDPNPRSDPLRQFILNYDYRLRNGGYGFNLIEGGAGERVFFSRGGKATP